MTKEELCKIITDENIKRGKGSMTNKDAAVYAYNLALDHAVNFSNKFALSSEGKHLVFVDEINKLKITN